MNLLRIGLGLFYGLTETFLVTCSDLPIAGEDQTSNSVKVNSIVELKQEIIAQPSNYWIDSRDQQKYDLVEIGGDYWFARNLNYADTSLKSWCYNNNEKNCENFGRLYDWHSAIKACPSGFHLPDSLDWQNLALFTGSANFAGTALKSSSKDWWSNGAGTNDVGFNALPAGYGDGSVYSSAGKFAYWWTSSENKSDSTAWYRSIANDLQGLYSLTNVKERGMSVRCIKNK